MRQVVDAGAAVHAQLGHRRCRRGHGVAAHGLQQRGALEGDGSPAPHARCAPPWCRASAGDGAGAPGLPVGRAQAGEGGHHITPPESARSARALHLGAGRMACSPSRSHCTTAPPTNTLPSKANSGVPVVCAALVVIRPLRLVGTGRRCASA